MNQSVKSYSLIPSTAAYDTADTSYYRFSRCILNVNILQHSNQFHQFHKYGIICGMKNVKLGTSACTCAL